MRSGALRGHDDSFREIGGYPCLEARVAGVFFAADAFLTLLALLATTFAAGFAGTAASAPALLIFLAGRFAAGFAGTGASAPGLLVFLGGLFAAGFAETRVSAFGLGASSISISKMAPSSSAAIVGAAVLASIEASGMACSISSR